MMADRLAIEPLTRPPAAVVRVPGSKSITNRALLLAALADGDSVIRGALFSDDTTYMADALQRLGVGVRSDPAAETFHVHGCAGRPPAEAATLFIGNAGTAARFLTACACLGHGRYVLDGTERMRHRPIGDLLAALRDLGAAVTSPTGCPPVTIEAHGLPGGTATVRGGQSSQYLSALLMVAPYAQRDVELEIVDDLIAKPYVDLTIAVMAQFGATVRRDAYRRFRVPHDQRYTPQTYAVEADASSAHYFLAAAALTGGSVRVEGIGSRSIQGDAGFASRVLEPMGATVLEEADAITVAGPDHLDGVDLDLNDISDTAITLAVLAPFATRPVRIRGVAHIRHQESERIASVTAELRKLGADVREREDGWEIAPSTLHGGEVATYDDHRLAMAFALIGLRVPGVVIQDPGCVSKTFPDYFERLEALRR